MEGNKDEALKCFQFAIKFLDSGHVEKAKKFAEKSIRLYPTTIAEELLGKINSDQASPNGSAGSHDHVRRRRRTNSGRKEEEAKAETKEKNYTPEQVEDVEKIKKCKDFYEVLSVSKSPSEADLKKSYRKLALKFHPDKNQAPGAAEAFKRIAAAFETLGDPEKKRKYDTYGENAGPTTRRTRRNYHEEEFEDISPEDIFNMFFGGGFPDGRVHVRRGRRGQQTYFRQNTHSHNNNHHQNENVSSLYPLVQILPVLLIILFSMLSSFLIPEPIFSFQPTSQYRYPMTTFKLGIKYYVKDRHVRQKHEDYNSIELKIEREFIETLQVRCYRERQYKAELRQQGHMWGSRELLEKADNYHPESCDKLKELQGRVHD
eukprot:TCONS_00000001-protein